MAPFVPSPAWPHGPITPFLDDLFYVVGTNRVTHAGTPLQTSRTMLVVREGARTILVNTVRLDDEGLAALDAIGTVTDIVRLGAFHGRDDPFYRDRYGARLWALPRSAHGDGRAADRALVAGGDLPIAGASLHVLTSAAQPEAALLLARSGGVLVTCDAIQNWAVVDRFFSAETGAMFQAAGFIRPVSIPATFIGACSPSVEDFDRLPALPFRHLITAHGEPLEDDAQPRVAAEVRRVFARGT